MTRRPGAAVLVFAAVALIHGVCPVTTSYDSRWTVHLALSMLERGDVNLDEYVPELGENQFYAVAQANGGYYSIYPIGGPALAVPLIFTMDKAVAITSPVLNRIAPSHPVVAAFAARDFAKAHALVELLAASLMTGATAAVLFLIASGFVSLRLALLLTFAFAFGTQAWSTASRALWQHTPSMLLLALTLWIAVRALTRPEWIQFASIPLSLAYCVRPTNAIPIAVFTVFVAVHYRPWLIRYLIWAIPAAAAFLAYNLTVFGTWLSPYYSLGPGPPGAWGAALSGLLLSPSRGLLVFTPWLVFSVWGAAIGWRSAFPPLFRYAALIPLIHTALLVFYSQLWWGGHSYGPRLFTDMLPFLVFSAVPLLKQWTESRPPAVLVILFGLLVTVSVAIHARGALSTAVHRWNMDPVNVDHQPSRVWDWSDPQFLRH